MIFRGKCPDVFSQLKLYSEIILKSTLRSFKREMVGWLMKVKNCFYKQQKTSVEITFC